VMDAWNKINDVTGEENFRIGFISGVHMMWDVFDDNSSVFKQI